jgi:release factor glutamine methyltransferase
MKNRQTSSKNPWTILKLLKWATDYFKEKKIDDPKAVAEVLLAQSLHLRRIDLYLQFDRPLEETELAAFKVLIKRKLKREPVAYIVGQKEFWSMSFMVSRDVLIPRPETECLVEAAMDIMDSWEGKENIRVLELGTGSGALVISLASQKRQNDYFASDISMKVLDVARKNADVHGLNEIQFFVGDWMAPLADKQRFFDVIVSNPPYIPRRQIETLAPEIHRYEPMLALDGDEDGLKCLRKIVQDAWIYLKPHGWLLLEMGYDQKEDMIRMAESCGKYDQIKILKDYSGHDRIIQMRNRIKD